jgi:two-component system response regulator HydG
MEPARMAAGDRSFHGIIGRSAAMQALFRRIERVAPIDVPVLIQGESGTGKELVASAVHRLSGRRDRPLQTVNSGALSRELLLSELFGHERGAFTGAVTQKAGLLAAAHGGTLFLDEVAELSPDGQVALLRFLQEGEIRAVGSTETRRVDVRVIAATHRRLSAMIAAGTFREDL